MGYLEITKAIFWGLKNQKKISDFRNSVDKCNECGKQAWEDDSFCNQHSEIYNDIVENGPYSRSFLDIIFD